MITLGSLWLPVLLAAMAVFVASSVIHLLLGYHRSDVRKLDKEDEIMDALRRFNIAPGDYMLPHAGSPEGMKKPEFIEKLNKGPVVSMTVWSPGSVNMGKSLLQWFLFCVLVGIFTAYLAGRVLGPGAAFARVLQVAGTAAFMGYSLALLHESIWYGRNWVTTGKFVFDGLVYGLVTGLVFAWLWPA